jgi:hypothetical protein
VIDSLHHLHPLHHHHALSLHLRLIHVLNLEAAEALPFVWSISEQEYPHGPSNNCCPCLASHFVQREEQFQFLGPQSSFDVQESLESQFGILGLQPSFEFGFSGLQLSLDAPSFEFQFGFLDEYFSV